MRSNLTFNFKWQIHLDSLLSKHNQATDEKRLLNH